MPDYVNFARVRELPEFAEVDTVYFVQPNADDPVRQFVTGDDAVPVEIAAATAAQQLFDAGLINVPTVAAMGVYLRAPAVEARELADAAIFCLREATTQKFSELDNVKEATDLVRSQTALVRDEARAVVDAGEDILAAANNPNVVAVGTDLQGANTIGIVAGGIDSVDAAAADLALGAGSFILRAPQAAVNAQNAQTATIAAMGTLFDVVIVGRPVAGVTGPAAARTYVFIGGTAPAGGDEITALVNVFNPATTAGAVQVKVFDPLTGLQVGADVPVTVPVGATARIPIVPSIKRTAGQRVGIFSGSRLATIANAGGDSSGFSTATNNISTLVGTTTDFTTQLQCGFETTSQIVTKSRLRSGEARISALENGAFGTRKAAEDAIGVGLLIPRNVVILRDEAHGFKATSNFFDGSDVVWLADMPFSVANQLGGRKSLWIDGSDRRFLRADLGGTVGIADGVDVAYARDKSGQGYDVTGLTAPVRPAYSASALGGAGGLLFAGADELKSAKLDLSNGADIVHILAVVKPTTTSGRGTLVNISPNNDSARQRIVLARDGGQYLTILRQNDIAAQAISAATNASTNLVDTSLVHVVFDARPGAGYLAIFADGRAGTSGSVPTGIGPLPNVDSAVIAVGGNGNGSVFLNGALGQAIVIAGDLSDYAIDNIYTTFAAKYGITVQRPGLFRRTGTPYFAWTWFSDPRAITTPDGGYILGGVGSHGDAICSQEKNGTWVNTMTYPGFQRDDHANPVPFRRGSDGRILLFSSAHNVASIFVQVSTNPDDASAFGPLIDLDSQLGHTNYSYFNVFQMGSGRLIGFYRATNTTSGEWAWHYSYTDDPAGVSGWTVGVQMSGDDRPYPKFCQNGPDRIDFIRNDGHPNIKSQNKTYHAYLKLTEGVITFHRTDGTQITSMPLLNTEMSLVYDASNGRSWAADIQIDGSGNPVPSFTVYPGSGSTTAPVILAYEARWNGTAWVPQQICDMGPTVYNEAISTDQPFYNGGICRVPGNPDIAYIGRKVNASGVIDPSANGVHQMFKYTRSGGVWTGVQKTFGPEKSFRPYVPVGGTDVWFLQGRYDSYTNYTVRPTKLALTA